MATRSRPRPSARFSSRPSYGRRSNGLQKKLTKTVKAKRRIGKKLKETKSMLPFVAAGALVAGAYVALKYPEQIKKAVPFTI